MAKLKVMLYGRPSRKDGTYTVYLRVHKKNIRKFISLGISVQEKDWDESAAKVKETNPYHKRLNNLIATRFAEASNQSIEMQTKDASSTTSQIVSKIKGVDYDYFKFAKSY